MLPKRRTIGKRNFGSNDKETIMKNKIEDNIRNFIDHMTKVTVRISTWNENGALTGRASGFFYQPESRKTPIIVSAGHKLPPLGSFIDTRVIRDDKTLSINAGKFNIFYNHDDIDYAFSELPVDIYKKELEIYKGVELIPYQHEFVKAVENEAYGFAVINDYGEFIIHHDGFILPSYCCYEVGLELVKQEEYINFFKPSRGFQGHEYYQGASGSPIADPEGAITSILVGGCEKTGLLRAFRLDNVELK
jgi:hypothetical protein